MSLTGTFYKVAKRAWYLATGLNRLESRGIDDDASTGLVSAFFVLGSGAGTMFGYMLADIMLNSHFHWLASTGLVGSQVMCLLCAGEHDVKKHNAEKAQKEQAALSTPNP